ncbi:porin [Pelagibacteraceae bacterium]|nr:porin [Pelagibacteraceae bacterium]
MKNITKILFVAITSLSMMFSVNAGELTVNGTAKATYNATSGTVQDNGLGVTNELNFTASGEMDNGYTWSYSMELDPSTASADTGGQANNDDTQLSLTMNDMGTIKVCVSECGNNKKYKFDQSAYTNMSDTGTSYGITYPGASGDANKATIQYHTPELPFATTVAVAFSTTSADGSSGNATGTTANGDSMNEYSLQSSPIDGLTLHAQVYDFNAYDDGVTTNDQSEEGGAYAATYAFGNATIGYGKSYKAPAILEAVRAAGATTVEYYENTGMSIGYAVNDDLSVSYTQETSEPNYMTSATVGYDIEMDSIQLAYSLGGATLSIARADVENVSYVENDDLTETIIAMSFAF